MKSSRHEWLLALVLLLAVPTIAAAQYAEAITGIVSDATGGVLPGVTITATHESSGNVFTGVTDERGSYRLPVPRTGVYRVAAELTGFATVANRVEILVGQQVTVNMTMSVSTVQESVTVTGEAPLLDVARSTVAGNVDPRQMEELPVNGRNWQSLAILAPGNRNNDVSESPNPRDRGDWQLNIDGQQVTNNIAGSGFGQPRFNRDAIGEFQFVSSRFDATQGRSSGVQVNAVTKAGTNTFAGSASAYFRDSSMNAADFVAGRVLPYQDQQISFTFGGPIVRDKIHFFANYQYEREPQTFVYTTPYPSFNRDLQGTRVEPLGGIRFDFQFPSQTHLQVRANTWRNELPYDSRYTGGGTRTPSSAIGVNRYMDQLHSVMSQVLSSRIVNQVQAGYAGFYWEQFSHVRNAASPTGTGFGAPRIILRGLDIGQTHTNTPQRIGQELYSVRDDLTLALSKHQIKVGMEYLFANQWLFFCNNCIGQLDLQGGNPPANLETLFPDMLDVGTWNLAPLSPLARTFRTTVGDFNTGPDRHTFAGWLQDDWTVTDRLTLNLGLRYDLATNLWAEDVAVPPVLPGDRPLDTNNWGPRVGFAYSFNDRTVARGGVGVYYGEVAGQPSFWTQSWSQQLGLEVANDGRPDFAANPFNGPFPTFEQALELIRLRGQKRTITSQLAGRDSVTPYSYQTSIGLQRQLGPAMAVEADYVFNGGRKLTVNRNINLGFDPVTGANFPATDYAHNPWPDFGVIQSTLTTGRQNLHALQTAFTKRFSEGWQLSGTYTLSWLYDADGPPYSGWEPVSFAVVPDLANDYSLAATDQRHRAVLNGIWQLPYGFQVSGLYFYGSGMRFGVSCGGDRRQTGDGAGRLCADGTILPRNSFVGQPVHRADMRFMRKFDLPGSVALDGMVEVFNVFNHENFGSYVTDRSNARYGEPQQNTNVAYAPRTVQLGIRLVF